MRLWLSLIGLAVSAAVLAGVLLAGPGEQGPVPQCLKTGHVYTTERGTWWNRSGIPAGDNLYVRPKATCLEWEGRP